jgi:hypothetical protein
MILLTDLSISGILKSIEYFLQSNDLFSAVHRLPNNAIRLRGEISEKFLNTG